MCEEINPQWVKRTDILVGIPSCCHAETIAFHAATVDEGLCRHFPELRAVLLVADSHSPDNTRDAFLSAETHCPKIYTSTPPGVKGKGQALRTILRKAGELEARAVLTLDADVRNITPEWIGSLLAPLFQSFAFVTPLYVRHKWESLCNTLMAYPLLRALLGRRVREPLAGELAFHGRLARDFLDTLALKEEESHSAMGLWMAATAMQEGVPICQAYMGVPRILQDSPCQEDPSVFVEAAGALFYLMGHAEAAWKRVRHSRPTAVCGLGQAEKGVPACVDIRAEAYWTLFREGFPAHEGLWREVLPQRMFGPVSACLSEVGACVAFPAALWAEILFETAFACHRGGRDLPLMLQALYPLYCLKVAAYLLVTQHATVKRIEERVEEECQTFERVKGDVMARWA